MARLRRVLASSLVSKHLPFTFLPPNWIYSKELVVIPTDDAADFAILQSRVHAIWARRYSGTLKSDLSYSISDALRTFPLPRAAHEQLREAGEAFFQARRRTLLQARQGLTALYNRFNDSGERDADIIRLRELHDAMDQAVLDAYGWTDIRPKCDFLLDHEIDEEDWGTKNKPYRYRWPDDVRDRVLGRLLDLNRVRAEEERLKGVAADAASLSSAQVRRLAKAKRVAELPEGGLPFASDVDEDDGEEK